MDETTRRALLRLTAAGAVGTTGRTGAVGGAEARTDADAAAGPPRTDGHAWPGFRYGRANAGYAGANDGPAEAVAVEWAFRPGAPTQHVGGPAVAGGRVYVPRLDWHSDAGALYCLDAASGEVVWRREHDAHPAGTPVVADGVVYYGDAAERLHAVAAADGDHRWTVPGAGADGPAMVDGTLYTAGREEIAARDPADGRPRWTVEAARPRTPAVVDGGAVYATATPADPVLLAVDPADGAVRWRRPVASPAPPVVGGDVVCLGHAGRMAGYRAADGDLAWERRAGGGAGPAVDLFPPAVAGGALYYACESGDLYAVDPATGDRETVLDRERTGSGLVGGPVGADGLVYAFSSERAVYAVDAATGAVRWEATLPAARTGLLHAYESAVADGTLYVVDDAGHLFALSSP